MGATKKAMLKADPKSEEYTRLKTKYEKMYKAYKKANQ